MASKNKLAKLTSVSTGDYPSPMSGRKQTAEDKLRERKYRAEDALRCLERAAEIVKDKALMADVQVLVKEKMKALKAVEGKKAA